jgi:hypothetical protein
MLQDPILRRAQEQRRPISFSIVPKVAVADGGRKKNQERDPHRRYPATEEKGTVTSTAVANAGGGGGSSSSKVMGDNVVLQNNEIARFCGTHLVPVASAYLSPYVRELLARQEVTA